MSDNELDAELLALAGDDSSSDEEDTRQTSRKSSRSPSQEARKSVEKAAVSPARRGVAQKLKSRAATKARKARKDESEEEGQASPSPESSVKSLGSAAMSESPSANSPGNLSDDAPLYPIDGRFKSEQDRAEIMAMNEIRREEILADRENEVLKEKQDRQLRNMLNARKREDHLADKRKRKPNDVDDGQRKSTRQKLKTNEPLEAYKRQRDLKGAAKARIDDRRKGHRSRSPSEDNRRSDQDADGESEVEWDDSKTRDSPSARAEPPLTLKDFDHVRIGRTNFAKYCFNPLFDNNIKGCFARVNVGFDSQAQRPLYRMAQIKYFKEGKPYLMEGQHGKKIHTNQYAVLAFGKAEKEQQFIACSDGNFTESEFAKYKESLVEDHLRFPSRSYILGKLDDINTMLSHSWTDSEIQVKVNKVSAMTKLFYDYGRERIMKRRDEALSRGDEVTVARAEKELREFDGPVKAGTPNKALAQQERLAALNKANRKANSDDVRAALLAERAVREKARAEAIAKARQRDADAKLLGVPEKDGLFDEASGASRAGTPMNGSTTPMKGVSRAGTPLGLVKREKTKAGFTKRPMDDDIIGAMDLGIELDL